MDDKLIEEVLRLVPEGWRGTVEELLRDFDPRLFQTHLATNLTKLGQDPDVTDISKCLSAIEKKLKKRTDIHLLIELSYPRRYYNSVDAYEDLYKLRINCSEGDDYYKGEFVTIGRSKTRIFSFAKTLPASNACRCQFYLTECRIDTCDILPADQLNLVPVDVKVIVTTESSIMIGVKHARAEGRAEGSTEVAKRFCDLIRTTELREDSEFWRNVKDIMDIMDKAKLAETASGSLVRQAQCLHTLPDEVSKFNHIMSQYKERVKEYNLRVVCNVRYIIDMSLPKGKYFSKYEMSQPDGAVFRESTAYIHGESQDAVLFSSSNDEEDISELLAENLAICIEAKVGDPVGQLFAGIDKLLADLIYEKLHKEEVVIKAFTLFGVYVDKCDQCDVYKFEVVLNQKTKMWKGRQRLPLPDVLNRLTATMTQLQ